MTYSGNRIKELRLAMGWTQQDLAAKLKTTKQAVSQYERGVRRPDLETVEVICDTFNVSSDYLLGRSNIVPRLVNTTEMRIIDRYREADSGTQRAVRKLLDVADDYLMPIAAHAHDDATAEDLTSDIAMLREAAMEKK